MANINCRIVKEINKPSEEMVNLFKGLPVANIDDCMNRMAAIDSAIRPYNKEKILGPAFTVKVPVGDNLMFHKAMDMAEPGDVIVIDAKGGIDRAIFGEIMVKYCNKRGIAGIIVDGCIRDVDAISQMNIPVYAKGESPNGPYKNGPGEINTPIALGGQVVYPGDIIVGDEDGVVVIKPEDAELIAEKTREVNDKEEKIMKTMDDDGSYLRPWVDDKLKSIDCDII